MFSSFGVLNVHFTSPNRYLFFFWHKKQYAIILYVTMVFMLAYFRKYTEILNMNVFNAPKASRRYGMVYLLKCSVLCLCLDVLSPPNVGICPVKTLFTALVSVDNRRLCFLCGLFLVSVFT